MRSYEKKPTLRMVDGGMFGAVKSMFSSAPPETITQKFARQDAEFRAKNPAVAGAPAVAAPPAPAASAPSGIPGYVGNSTLDGRMKAAGLRDGGTPYSKGSRDGGRVVGPGDGTVDTVDAKYANGEYVLPADTALAIGHDQLDALKDATHTPVALQRAYDGRSNGGQHGQGTEGGAAGLRGGDEVGHRVPSEIRTDRVRPPGLRNNGAPLLHDAAVNEGRQGTLRLADGGRWPLDGELRNPNVVPGGSAEARAFQFNQPGGAGPMQPAGPRMPVPSAVEAPTLRNPLSWAQGISEAGRATGEGAKKVAGASSRIIGEAGKAVGAGAVKHIGSIANTVASTAAHGNAFFDPNVPTGDKLRIGATDAAAALGGGVGTLFGGTMGSVVPVAGTIAGGVAGGLAGEKAGRWAGDKLFGGSDAQSRNGYDPKRGIIDVGKDTLRNGLSEDLFGGPARQAATPPALAKPAQSATNTVANTVATPSFSAGDATMPGQDPGQDPGRFAPTAAAPTAAPTLRNPPGVPLAGAPGVFKSVQNGKTSYSNVPGDQGSGYGVSVVPGRSREQLDSSLINPNGTRWREVDNAIMDANRRDGVDLYRGTSRDPRNDPDARLQELAYSPKGTPGRKFAQQQLESRANHAATLRSETLRSQTTMRGQDMDSSDRRYTADSSAANAKNSARAEAESKQRAYDLDIAKFGEEKAKTMFNQREQSDKDLTGKLESMFTTPDDKGNAVVDRATVASHKAGVYSYIANTIDKLSKVPRSSPDYARSQQTAEALRSQSTSALGPDRLEKLITQLEIKKRSAAASGVGPFSGSHTDSSDPSAYDVVGKDSGLLQDQYTLRNGSRVPARALDYDNGGNSILPNSFGNRPTDRFNLVKKDLRNGN